MFSSVLAICGLLFLEVSGALDPSYFNLEKSDYSHSLYREIMDIFTDSPNTTTLQSIGLISDNLDEFSLPIKLLHEDEKPVIMGQNEPAFLHSSFVEINCRQFQARGILDYVLPRVIASYTVVVILKGSEDLHFHEIETCMLEVFKKFWTKPAMNVVIMFPGNRKTSRIFSYVYEPYHEEPLRNVTGMSFHKIFHDKAANLHLYPLKVLAYQRHRFFMEIEDGALQAAGIDGCLTEILDQIFNATVILTVKTESERSWYPRRLYQHLVELKNGSIDMWMNVHIIYPDVWEGVTYTYPRERMDIICILPKEREGQVKYKSIGGGSVYSFVLMVVPTLFLVSFFVFLSNKILLQNMPLLKLAKVLLNQSDSAVQKTPTMTIRVLFSAWLAASLVYSTLLQTLITSRIIRPSAQDRLETIQDVIDFDIRLRIEKQYWEITRNHYDEEISRSIQNNIDVVSFDNLFTVQTPDIGYLSTKDVMESVDGERTRFYVLKESFLPNLAAYYFPKKSPFIRRFNRALTAITESGITRKWITDNHHRYNLGLKSNKAIAPTKYITCKNLKSVVYFYGIGVSIAVAVFICEIKFR